MSIQTDIKGNHKVTYDDMNERVRYEEWKCKCGDWVDDDDVIWAMPDGTLDTDKGEPFCDVCLPQDPNEE